MQSSILTRFPTGCRTRSCDRKNYGVPKATRTHQDYRKCHPSRLNCHLLGRTQKDCLDLPATTAPLHQITSSSSWLMVARRAPVPVAQYPTSRWTALLPHPARFPLGRHRGHWQEHWPDKPIQDKSIPGRTEPTMRRNIRPIRPPARPHRQCSRSRFRPCHRPGRRPPPGPNELANTSPTPTESTGAKLTRTAPPIRNGSCSTKMSPRGPT